MLAEFASSSEEQKIISVLPVEVSYWIGLTDSYLEGTFRWEETHSEPSYDNWGRNQPNGGDERDCVALDCMNFDLECKWNDYGCDGGHMSGLPIFPLCQRRK